MPPLVIAGVVAAAGAIGGSAIAAHGATKAADAQAKAATSAAGLQTQLGQEGLNLQTEQLNNASEMTYPYALSGYAANANLDNLMGLPVNGSYSPTAPQYSTPGIPGIAPGTGGGTVPLSTMAGGTPGGTPPQTVIGPNGKPMVIPGTPGTSGTVTAGHGGSVPLSSLINPSLGAKGSLAAPFTGTFKAPTLAEAEAYPGYQFQLSEGTKALQNSAAARGNLLTGQTSKDIMDYAQNLAQTDYGNVWNQKMSEFNTGYNVFENNQTNLFNRLSALSGGGQLATNELNNNSLVGVNNTNKMLLGTGAEVGQDIQNAGAARASGYVGADNAWAKGVGSLSQLGYLAMLNRPAPSGPQVSYGQIPGIENGDYIS